MCIGSVKSKVSDICIESCFYSENHVEANRNMLTIEELHDYSSDHGLSVQVSSNRDAVEPLNVVSNSDQNSSIVRDSNKAPIVVVNKVTL